MARCEATTKKGTRCRNDVLEGSRYCHVHRKDERRRNGAGGGPGETGRGSTGFRLPELDAEELLKTAVGFALVGAVVILALTRRR